MSTFSRERWQAMWADLPEATRRSIRAKAKWEGMSLSAVVREWWPDLWAKVTDDR